MRRFPFSLGAFLAAAISPFGLGNQNFVNFVGGTGLSKAPGKRRKQTRRYPHSSERQRARYARQIAAGQLNMEGVRK